MSAPTIATENGLQHEDNDVPVNKTTTFNGRLNQYFHTSKFITDRESPLSKAASNTPTRAQQTPPKGPNTSLSHHTHGDTLSIRASHLAITIFINTTNNSNTPSQPTTPTTPSTPNTSNSLLRDTIPPNLTLLLVGVNPGIQTGLTGFAYAHPSNLFWKLLHASGITPIRHPPSDTYRLPALYNIGNTNIVERATRDAAMLTRAEMNAGVPVLEAKIAAQRPEVVCLVGKSIWEAVWRVRRGRAIRKEEFRYGWQDEGENMGRSEQWGGARVFVATTTSGLAAGMSRAEKQAVWDELGEWVVRRREERGG
ncbi:DNA glycosylase [Aspergillus campestris IBT 28561]|uniref:DNA glycosylase n=1 Tax=Aspergillus campestris (strain IBT 28561) TaxID=1392248 RepID=A0A2I1DA07_ASPC2|nr:DNA glycosylase [Aspergillus campestris IBT 28561]PKY06713.1 DNA glycosylase [Aspergillus campestris IBT 28561]